MNLRNVIVSMVAATLTSFPAGASQPRFYAGKLIANPVITVPQDDSGFIPPVVCTGFYWGHLFQPRQLDPLDTVKLEMAIVPFRTGATEVILPRVMILRFAEGLVNGLPYKRLGWNDVVVEVRPATQDYMLTLNGVQAGPFPNTSPCAPGGDCFTLEGFILQGGVFDESVAWIDSISLAWDSAAGREVLFRDDFDGCYASRDVELGGVLMIEPPQRLSVGEPR